MTPMHCLIPLLFAVVPSSLEHDLSYVASLRQARLYRLSHQQGELLLENDGLTDQQRVQVVVEVSKTLAAQALNSRMPQREAFWQQTSEVISRELQIQQSVAGRLVLQAQQAFLSAQQSAWATREAEITARTEKDWEPVRVQLRQAIRGLQKVEQNLRSANLLAEQSIPDQQRLELSRNVQLQLGESYLLQAMTYAQSPRDRTSAATRALSYFEPLGASRLQDEITWQSRIGQIRCARILQRFSQAESLLQRWASTPTDHLGEFAAEGIRLAIETRNLEAALQLAGNQSNGTEDPEFQLARIEALVTAAKHARGTPNAPSYGQLASDIAASLAGDFGTYWGLRGEIQLTRLASEVNANSNALRTAAETMLRKDAPESAKQMFLKAAEKASEQESTSSQFEFLYKAALVDHREGRLQQAIDGLKSVACSFPRHGQASEAHLLAIFDAAALFQEFAASKNEQMQTSLRQYEELLDEHLRHWPQEKSADQARIWAGKLAQAKRHWARAAELYRGVSIDSAFEIEAYHELGKVLWQGTRSSSIREDEVRAQRNWMVARMENVREAARQTLALEAARLAVHAEPKDYELALKLMKSIWRQELEYNFKRDAGLLLILAAFGEGQSDLANTVFRELVPLPKDTLLKILRGLQPIRQQRRSDPGLKSMTLEVLELLRNYEKQLEASDVAVVRRARADYVPLDQKRRAIPGVGQEFPVEFRYSETVRGAANGT